MADTFTYFEKFGDVCEALTEEDRKEVIYAITMYGTFGVEIELPYPHNAYFALIKDSLDFSKTARTNGSKGGRPKNEPTVPEDQKPSVIEDQEPTVGGNGKAQTIPNHTEPNHTEPNDKKGGASASPPYEAIISYLNEKAGTNYRASAAKSRQHINARWAEGYRLEDFKAVIDKKVAEWLNDPKFGKYLRPETLFGTKFEGYLNAPAPKGVKDYGKYDR